MATHLATAFTLTVTPQNQPQLKHREAAFTVESNTSWTVSDNATWLTVSPENGTGNGAIIAAYEENTTTAQRIGTITVTGGGITKTVTVTQSATAFTLTVTPQNQSVTNASGSTQFTVESNTTDVLVMMQDG
ncbi:MAG: BACON domain-containing protein [Ignavibacteriales bacterium]|nr:BACON domain-containing protein [Ignavibacteriales bacterium]